MMRKRFTQRAFLEAEARYLERKKNVWKCPSCGEDAYEYAESGKCYFCFDLDKMNEAAEREEYFECKRGHSRCTRCG